MLIFGTQMLILTIPTPILRRFEGQNYENNLLEIGLSEISKKTFINDGVRLWNSCPSVIKQSKSLFTAKKEIKKFVINLPI